MAKKLKPSIFVNLLFILLINNTLPSDKITIPSCGYCNLFFNNHSNILFIDNGKGGLYSLNLKDKDVKKIVEENKLISSICSIDKNIFLIYSKPGIVNLSLLDDRIQEEIIYSFPFRKGGLCFPAVSPSHKKIALIEIDSSTGTTNLIIINQIDHSKDFVAKLNEGFPVLTWNSGSDKLYYFNRTGEKPGFYVWNENTGNIEVVKEVRDMSLLYLYPNLIKGRYILFLGEDDNGTQILGKLDLDSLQINSREIEGKDYTIMMLISFTPDNRFIYQVTHRSFKRKENKVYLSDINLKSRLILKDHSESLIPIGYNKVLDGLVFFRNQKEIISINLNDPSKQKVLYAIPNKNP